MPVDVLRLEDNGVVVDDDDDGGGCVGSENGVEPVCRLVGDRGRSSIGMVGSVLRLRCGLMSRILWRSFSN